MARRHSNNWKYSEPGGGYVAASAPGGLDAAAQVTAPQYTAEPDWTGLAALHQQDAMREATHQSLLADSFAKKFGLGNYGEVAAQNQAKLEQIRLKAEMDASVFEKRYTAKQKAEIAHWKGVPGNARASGLYDEAQLQKITEFAKMREMGIQPQDMPKLSNFSQGQGVGEVWEYGGGVLTRDDKGNPKIMYRPDQMPQWQEREQELDAIKKKSELETKREEWKAKFREKLATQRVKDPIAGTDRGLTPQEMSDLYESAYPSTPMPSDEDVQNAEQFIDEMMERWGGNPPPGVAKAIVEAGKVIKRSKAAW